MRSRFLHGLAAVLLLLAMGCKEDGSSTGGTAGVALYAFDSTTSQVMVWRDLSAFYDDVATPAPSYQISSSLFSKVTNLAWGGMCLDTQRGLLYLVSETGDIIRLSRIRSQSGTAPSVDIASFRLASGDRLTNGKFGQATLDAQTDSLFITESGDNGTRIWVVAGASQQPQDASVTLQAIQASGDTAGTGVAASGGSLYAYMNDGNPVGPDAITGPRLRRGNASAFDPSLVILGKSTELGVYGTLALDTANGYLFVGRHNTDATATTPPVLAFRTGQFGLSYDQAPAQVLGDAASQPDLRVLTHAGVKDWLVGLRGQGTTGYAVLWLWKSPLGGSAAKVKTVAPAGTVFKGVAVDGNAA
jgi:hypothetical protein